MHEMSLAMAVVDQVEETGRAHGAVGVEEVRLQVGELAGVVPDALHFCFELACAGGLLAGARLTTEAVPGRARCADCPHEWATGMPPRLCCPRCDRPTSELLSGRELHITGVRWAEPPATVTTHPTSPALKER